MFLQVNKLRPNLLYFTYLTSEAAIMESLGENNSGETSNSLSRSLVTDSESTNLHNRRMYIVLMGFILALGAVGVTTGMWLSSNNNSSGNNNRGGNRKYKLTMGSSDICAVVAANNGTEVNGTVNGVWEPNGEITIGINQELYYSTIKLILESCTYKKYMNTTDLMGKSAITCNSKRCYIDDVSSPGNLYSVNGTSTEYLYSFDDPARECAAFNMEVYRYNQSFTCEGKGTPDSTRLDPRIVTDEGDDNNVWNLILSPAYTEGTAIINCKEDKSDIGDIILDCYKEGFCITRDATSMIEATTTHPCKTQLFITDDNTTYVSTDDDNVTVVQRLKTRQDSNIGGYGPLFRPFRGSSIEPTHNQSLSLRRGNG
jgi:hypothetical protein